MWSLKKIWQTWNLTKKIKSHQTKSFFLKEAQYKKRIFYGIYGIHKTSFYKRWLKKFSSYIPTLFNQSLFFQTNNFATKKSHFLEKRKTVDITKRLFTRFHLKLFKKLFSWSSNLRAFNHAFDVFPSELFGSAAFDWGAPDKMGKNHTPSKDER